MDQRAPLPMAGADHVDGDHGRRPVMDTLLALTAEVMEASFQRLGEGIIMGSMPRYLRRFGMQNARYLQDRYVHCDPRAGAVSALTAINFVSRATQTAYKLPVADAGHAVKRLEECEFQEAFRDKSDFAKAMVCRLHQAVYEGSVNALVEDPRTQGYRVELQSRILFGDRACDFHVRSVPPRSGPDTECPTGAPPSGAELVEAQRHFYAAILVSFIEYLCQVLPEEEVRLLLADCADRVGAATKVPGETVRERLRNVLTMSDREVEDEDDALVVTRCAFVRPIKGSARGDDPVLQEAVRKAACGTCTSFLGGVARDLDPDAALSLRSSLAAGDTTCRFAMEGSG